MSQGSYGGFHLSVYYQTGQDQGHIRNKCVVQTQVCPLLVDIEMNRSCSNPGALLAHQNVKTGVSSVYGWSIREVLPEQVARHWDCTFVNRSSCYPGALLAHWKIKTGVSHSTGPCKQVQ